MRLYAYRFEQIKFQINYEMEFFVCYCRVYWTLDPIKCHNWLQWRFSAATPALPLDFPASNQTSGNIQVASHVNMYFISSDFELCRAIIIIIVILLTEKTKTNWPAAVRLNKCSARMSLYKFMHFFAFFFFWIVQAIPLLA